MTPDSIATEADFTRHAQNLAAGFAAMNPTPSHRNFTNPYTTNTMPIENTEHPTNSESASQQVLRESGLLAPIELTLGDRADISALTKTLLSKAEKSKLAEISEACDRLGAEIERANEIPRNPAKVAAAWSAEHPGEPVPQELIETASRGEELRRFAKQTAKAAALAFFNEHAKPLIFAVFEKAADLLRDAITERVKLEREAFEKFAELYHDGDSVTYRPSPGLLRMLTRRRQLIDKEIFFSSPPSVKAALEGIFAI